MFSLEGFRWSLSGQAARNLQIDCVFNLDARKYHHHQLHFGNGPVRSGPLSVSTRKYHKSGSLMIIIIKWNSPRLCFSAELTTSLAMEYFVQNSPISLIIPPHDQIPVL